MAIKNLRLLVERAQNNAPAIWNKLDKFRDVVNFSYGFYLLTKVATHLCVRALNQQPPLQSPLQAIEAINQRYLVSQIENSLPVFGTVVLAAFAISYVAQTGMNVIENGDLSLREMIKFNLRKHGFLICCALTDLLTQ